MGPKTAETPLTVNISRRTRLDLGKPETVSPLGAIRWTVLAKQPRPRDRKKAVAEPDEKVVRVTSETWGTHWGIRDMEFGLWRTRYPLDDSEAWSRDLGSMAKYASSAEAATALREMWQQRLEAKEIRE